MVCARACSRDLICCFVASQHKLSVSLRARGWEGGRGAPQGTCLRTPARLHWSGSDSIVLQTPPVGARHTTREHRAHAPVQIRVNYLQQPRSPRRRSAHLLLERGFQ
jgi:hypothetical protein